MKPSTPLLQSTRLLDQVRERIRYWHDSLKTEKAYLYWIRFFIRWSAKQGGIRHPRDMGMVDVEAFLSMLANERKVSASTHNQTLSALLFLYREVLNIDLPWLNNIGRPQQTKRIPTEAYSVRTDQRRGRWSSGPVGRRCCTAGQAAVWHRYAFDGRYAPAHQGCGL